MHKPIYIVLPFGFMMGISYIMFEKQLNHHSFPLALFPQLALDWLMATSFLPLVRAKTLGLSFTSFTPKFDIPAIFVCTFFTVHSGS